MFGHLISIGISHPISGLHEWYIYIQLYIIYVLSCLEPRRGEQTQTHTHTFCLAEVDLHRSPRTASLTFWEAYGGRSTRPTPIELLLVGGWPTPLKNISWDDDIPNI